MTEEQPDLTLPKKVPEMDKYHDKPMEVLPFAFYALCNLDSKKMEAYRKLCATDLNDDTIKLPPQSKFLNKQLREVVKYHVELGAEGLFDRRYFVVCVYEDSHTVVVVTLDDDDLKCTPDLLWINIDESGSMCANLQIANITWYEAKEEKPDGPEVWPPSPKRHDH